MRGPPDRPPCPGLAPPEESTMTETLIPAAETSPSPRGLSRHGPWAGGPRMTPAGAPLLCLGHLSSPLDSEEIRGLCDPLCVLPAGPLWKICLNYMFLERSHCTHIIKMLVGVDKFEVPTDNIPFLYKLQCLTQVANHN